MENDLIAVDDLEEGIPRRVEAGGTAYAVVRIGEEVFAVGDRCSHAEASLSEGEVDPDECVIYCPRHDAAFDLRTGEPLSLPAVRPVPCPALGRRDGIVILAALTEESGGGS